jgi:hypothetical protein
MEIQPRLQRPRSAANDTRINASLVPGLCLGTRLFQGSALECIAFEAPPRVLTAEQWHLKATDEIRGQHGTDSPRVAERRHSH